MATVWQVETHESIVWAHNGLVNLEVGWGAGQALNVDTPLVCVEVEGLESTLLAGKLDLVDELVATVVPGTWITLRVLVGHWGSKGIEDGTGGDILRGNQQDGLALSLDLLLL
jgi:hypothetical protein